MHIDFSLITLISMIVALLIHPIRKYADRQAQLYYIERVGNEYALKQPKESWLEDRHLVGRWGCLYILLQAVQGVAIIVTIGGVVYWWLF
jgi:hypothetical protein